MLHPNNAISYIIYRVKDESGQIVVTFRALIIFYIRYITDTKQVNDNHKTPEEECLCRVCKQSLVQNQSTYIITNSLVIISEHILIRCSSSMFLKIKYKIGYQQKIHHFHCAVQ